MQQETLFQVLPESIDNQHEMSQQFEKVQSNFSHKDFFQQVLGDQMYELGDIVIEMELEQNIEEQKIQKNKPKEKKKPGRKPKYLHTVHNYKSYQQDTLDEEDILLASLGDPLYSNLNNSKPQSSSQNNFASSSFIFSFSPKTSSKASTVKTGKKCKCKKTMCLKKYCQCYASGLICGIDCQCDNCENREKIEDQEEQYEKYLSLSTQSDHSAQH